MRRSARRRSQDGDRTQRTARLADDRWVLPWGLGRQVDHASSAFVARLPGEGLVNRTGRRWTLVGVAGGPVAAVDPAGLVTPRLGGWSIDWWVGADDRWRLPSREPSVRQALLEATPVLETAMRVPGGDAVHRCFAVPGFLVIEVENRSAAPFALALAIRPYDPLGAAAVGTVAVRGDEVVVDGRTALVLPTAPGPVAASTGAGGDVAGAVLTGGAGPSIEPTTCPDGLASLAVLLPVAHRATVRAVVPLANGEAPRDLPSAPTVVRGWQAQSRCGMRVEVPDPLLQGAFDAALLQLLLIDSDEPWPAEEAAVLVAALSRFGRHAEADDLVRALWSRQRTDGSFDEPGGSGAPGGPHLWALGEHLRLRPDAALAAALDRGLVAAEGWLRELEAAGPLSVPAHRWAIAGRRGAAAAAGEAGRAIAASDLLTGASAVLPGVEMPSPEPTAQQVLWLAAAGSEPGRAPVTGPAGTDVVAALAVAAGDLSSDDGAALDRLTWMLERGAPTWSWPDHVHPRTGAGSAGRGSSPPACAAFLLLVHDLVVTETLPGHVDLVRTLPQSWRGQPLEVHDAVLSGGVRLSYAVRWHGPRPALLWQASSPVWLSAPGLDPSFRTDERSGEVLLDGPPSTVAPDGGTVELS